ncbi:MAG: hypothetical protein WAS25_12230 [Geothrix sp.]|uniref:DUF3185 domain-containing protein n=1 Tax=Geothrix sp. TaxID=1962974 RepID=UPI003BB19984
MKPNTLLAVLLITVGIAALIYQGVTYTTREKVVDVGTIHVMADKTRSIPLPPVFGILAIVGGVVLLTIGNRSR